MLEKTPSRLTIGVAMGIGIIAISFSSIFVKWSDAPASVIAMNRLFITNLLLLPWLLGRTGEIRRLRLRSTVALFGSGVMLGLHFLFWMDSLNFTSVASSTALMTLEPVFVMLGAYIVFREKASRGAIFSVGIALCGALLISWGDFGLSADHLKGDMLSLLGTAAVAVHVLLGKTLRNGISALVYSYIVFLVGGIVLLAYNVALGLPLFDYKWREWGVFALLAIVSTVFGHVVFNWLLKYVRAASVSMCVLGEPVGATLLAYWLLGETIGWLQAFACALLLGGVWFFLRKDEALKRD